MAESAYTVSVPIDAETSKMEQKIRAAIERASASATVTLGGESSVGRGGQYARATSRSNPTEQAAVDRAYAMAQEKASRYATPGGYNAAGGAAAGGFSPNIDTAASLAALQRVRVTWEALKAEIENSPIRMSIAGGGMPGVSGGATGAVMGIPLPVAQPVTSVMGIPVMGPGGQNNLPMIAAAAQARVASQAIRSSAGRSGLNLGSFGNIRFGVAGMGGLRGYGSALVVAHELMGASQMLTAGRDADVDRMMADTPEEMNLISADAALKESQSSFTTRLFTAGANWMDLSNSPERMARDAKMALAARRMRDATRRMQIANTIGVRARGARARQGQYGYDQWMIADQRDAELAAQQDQVNQLDERLRARDVSTGELVIPEGSELRSEVGRQSNAIKEAMGQTRARADEAAQLNRREKDDFLLAAEVKASHSNSVMRGASEREIRIQGIRGEGMLRRRQYEKFGPDLGGALGDTLLRGELGEEEIGFQRDRLKVNESIQHAIRQTRFRRGGPRYRLDAEFDDIATATGSDARALEEQGMGDEAAWRRRLGRLQLSGARDDYLRSFRFQEGSPTRMAGTVKVDDIDKKLRDAQDRIDKEGRDSNGAGLTAAELRAKIEDIAGYLRTIATGYKPARAG